MPGPEPTTAFVRNAFITFALILLFLSLLAFPRASFTTQHDSSSAATFEYYAAKKVQFGVDVYQNIGPLGYVLYSDDFTGLLHWQKVILKNTCRLGLVILVCWLMRSLASPVAQICWFASFFVFFPFGDATSNVYLDLHDNLAYLTIYLQGLWLLQNRDDRQFQLLSMAGWFFLAFLSLNKNTFFIFTCAIVLATTTQNLYRRKPFRTIRDLLAVTASLVAVWTLADQRLEHLPGFIHGVFAFSSGYNEALALKTPLPSLILGTSVLLLFAVRIICNWCRTKGEFGKSVIEAFLLFIVWKHGFVRSDEHMLIFFYAALLLVVPVFFYNPDQRDCSPHYNSLMKNRVKRASCLAVYGLCLISFFAIIHDCHYRPIRIWNQLRYNASWVASPRGETKKMALLLAESQTANSLPAIKSMVGQSTIDFFGFEPGYLLLNKLNYSQRPMPITFAAANRYLQEANEGFYRDPARAPAYILYQPGSIDNRLSLQDDALAWRALLETYRPVLQENGFLLLRRQQTGISAGRRYPVIGEYQLRFNQTLALEDMNKNILWLEVKIEHTVLGKLLALFYKPPPCSFNLQFEGGKQNHDYKFVTSMGECGFMLTPFLDNTGDLARFYSSTEPLGSFPKVTALTFSHEPKDILFFKDEIHVQMRMMERPGQ